MLAKLRIERAERLVEQKQLRSDHQGPGKRNSLLLPAGQLTRIALGETGQANQIQRIADAAAALLPRNAAHSQAESDIVRYAHMGKERKALKHETNLSPVWRQALDVLSIHRDPPPGRPKKAGYETQGRRLPATTRTQEGYKFAFRNRQAYAIDRKNGTESLCDPLQRNGGHRNTRPLLATWPRNTSTVVNSAVIMMVRPDTAAIDGSSW